MAAGKDNGKAAPAQPGAGTVSKAFQIAQFVTSSPRHYATVTEIAEELSLPRPTANRIVSNLIKLGMLKRDGGGQRIIEGDELVRLAGATLQGAASRGPRHEILRQLVLDTRETVNVGTISNGQVVYLDRVEAMWPLAFRLEVGSQVPLHCSALGKLLLAQMGDAQFNKYLAAMDYRPRTANTIRSRSQLEAELARVREEGSAIDNEECFEGVIGIAIPVGTLQPSIGLALVAPSSRLTADGLREFLPAMHDAARRLAACYS